MLVLINDGSATRKQRDLGRIAEELPTSDKPTESGSTERPTRRAIRSGQALDGCPVGGSRPSAS